MFGEKSALDDLGRAAAGLLRGSRLSRSKSKSSLSLWPRVALGLGERVMRGVSESCDLSCDLAGDW